jgi:hypothetical protein
MPWLRRRSERARSDGHVSEMVDDEIYGPVWIADANDPNVTLEEHDEWLTWEQAEAFAQKRALPVEDV